MELYEKMGDDLRHLLHNLLQGKDVKNQLIPILALAHRMGEPMLSQAKELQQEIEEYLKKPHHTTKIKERIRKLEQQTRDL